jgi:hypothetical protein
MAGPVTSEEMRMLLRREPGVRERTWTPTAGGILIIMAGVLNILFGIGVIVGGTWYSSFLPSFDFFQGGLSTISTTVAGILIALGLLSVIGGVYAQMRRGWPVVFAGSLAALVPNILILPFFMGVLGLIFNVIGHPEFKPRTTMPYEKT